jgi:hypothetical protein
VQSPLSFLPATRRPACASSRGDNITRSRWRSFAKYVDETYAIADSTWIGGDGKTPGGLSLAELEQQMQALKTA